jgi:hypothetical protein
MLHKAVYRVAFLSSYKQPYYSKLFCVAGFIVKYTGWAIRLLGRLFDYRAAYLPPGRLFDYRAAYLTTGPPI